MRAGVSSRAFSGASVGLAAAGLAIAMAVGLFLWPQQTNKGAPVADPANAVSELEFRNAEGMDLTLADFRGRAVLLNVWATWCGPCRKEMPALDRLQARLGGPEFQVIALSIDRGGLDRVQPFFDEIGIANLAIYLDTSAAAMSALGITGTPTTLLIDPEGREIRRWAGPAEWDSPKMEALIREKLDLATASMKTQSSNAKVKQWTALPATRL